jgi:hypothetical protein
MGVLTVVALGLSIGQWQRPIAGVLVDPNGLVDNFGWPTWSAYQQGLAYPDRIVAIDEHTLTVRAGNEVDEVAARAYKRVGQLPGLPDTQPEAQGRPMKILVEQGAEARVYTVRAERLGFGPWMLLSGGYLVLAWVWLCAAGLLYTARPQSRAVGAFVRWVLIGGTLLITLFDFHTTRQLVPITLVALACFPSSLIEFGLCFPERIPSLQARPRLLWLLRVLDVVLILLTIGGYLRGRNLRFVSDMASAAAMVVLTIILSLRCATAHGRRRVQLLTALLLLLPIYAILGTLLLWAPERAAPYLFVAVIPLTVFGALGMAYALLRYDLWDSRTLLRRPGVRPFFTTALSFVASLLCALGFIVIRRSTEALPIIFVLLAVALAGPLVRRAAEWIDAKLFPTDVHYRDTVEQLSLRFTDLGSQAAVVEAVEQAVRQVVDCARVRLLPKPGPLWTPGTDSADLGRFLPKIAQVMAAAIANEKSASEHYQKSLQLAASSSSSSPIDTSVLSAAATPTPVESRNLRVLRRIVKSASLFALSAEQEKALARGELVYLSPKAPLVSSVPALWSWLLISVRFRDRIVGVLAVAPKSVAQIFTPTSESLLRTIANQSALALYCASVSEQFEILLRAQEGQAREQFEGALSALADEIHAELDADQTPAATPEQLTHAAYLLAPLKALAAPRALKRQPQALRPLVERTRQLLRDRLLTRLLEVDLSPTFEIDGDAEALLQILSSLLANALDACAPPGRIGMTASAEADQRLRITIWDSGPGPLCEGDRLLPLILAADKRTAAFRQIIAQRLVRAHGWEIVAGRRSDRNSVDVLVPASEWRRRRPPEGADDEEEAPGA